jgi:ATP-binding cassette subfamily B protein
MTVATAPARDPRPSGDARRTLAALWRAFTFLHPFRRFVFGAYAATAGVTLLNLAIPQVIRWAIDHGIAGRDLGLLGRAAAILLALGLLRWLLVFTQGRWSEVASQNVAYELRGAVQRQLTALSFAYHDRAQTGELLSRTVQDVDRVRFLTGRSIVRLLDGAILMIGTAAILLWMNPRLALLAIGAMPLMAYRAIVLGRVLRPLALTIQRQLAVLTTRVEQSLRGARAVKAFAQEEAEIARFRAENEHWYALSVRAASLQAFNIPLLSLIANIGAVLILWYGGVLVIRGEATLGALIAFTVYLAQLINPVRMFGQVIPAIAIAAAAAERVFEVLDTAPEVRDAADAQPLPPIKGRVRFEHISFGYGSRRQVLHDVDFEAQPGQVIALVGRTGSGKTTVANLIPRFYDPTAGRITVDGHDIRGVTLHSLRSQIGMVLQETTLFAASIRENIAFGRAGATEAEIEAAARAAQAHDFIVQTPHGYDSQVGERGVTLSGGQKQRIAIARALLADPRILVLDDATSSMDTETERRIQQALEAVMVGRTTFVIAHRLSTVRRADLILLLDRGRVAARGVHDDLLQTSPLYADICRRQLRGAAESLSTGPADAGGRRPRSPSRASEEAR